jgi:hypothetical protein
MSIAAVRCRIEKMFGTWKRSYGLARMRFIGLGKTSLQGSLHRNRPQSPAYLANPCSTIRVML